MTNKKILIPVQGMHCNSCEMLLERGISKIKNVSRVKANQRKGEVEIYYGDHAPNMDSIEHIIHENGYKIGESKKLPWLQNDSSKYVEFIMILSTLFALYLIALIFGFDFSSAFSLGTPSYSVAFFVGITAGFSSCMALVGGLILGVSTKWNQDHMKQSTWYKFEPHLFFNLGRVLGFGFLGGLLGVFGSFISISNWFLGLLTLAVGIVMIILGISLSELSPRLKTFSITLPKFLGKYSNHHTSGPPKLSAFISGAMSFFLPCGFTLAMQVYAISSKSFLVGGITLMLFALGTAPGLLGVGGLVSFMKGRLAQKFFKFVGVIVLILGIFNMSNASNLLTLGLPFTKTQQNITTSNEVQEIKMIQDSSGYNPNTLFVKPNTKIKWIIDSTNPYSCASQLIVPSLGINKSLNSGENIIEFVSPSEGEIKFSCSMGMYTGKIVVANNL